MKKNHKILIFVFTKTEVQYALQYKRNHEDKVVKILPGSIGAFYLLSKNISEYSDYSEIVSYRQKNYYRKQLVPLFKRTTYYFEKISCQFNDVTSFGIPIVSVLKLLIEAQILNVIYANFLYKKINEKWQPDVYMFSQDIDYTDAGWEPRNYSVAALIAKYLCDKNKIVYFKTIDKESIGHKINVINFLLKTKLLAIPSIILLLVYRFKQFRLPEKKHSVYFLFFSAGVNLHYYHKTLIYLQSQIAKIPFLVIAGQQTIGDELLIRKVNLRFLSLDSYWNSSAQKLSKDSFDSFMLKYESVKRSIQKMNYLIDNSTQDNVNTALFDILDITVNKYAAKFIKRTFQANNILLRTNPKLMVTTHDPGPSALPFVLLAKKKQIRTLVLLHGFHDSDFGSKHYSDYIAVWGSLLNKRFVATGKPKTKVISTGFPLMDKYTKFLEKPVRSDFSFKFSTPIKLGFLVTLYQLDSFIIPHFFTEIYKVIKTIGIPIEIWIRTHAGQDLGDLNKIAQLHNIDIRYNPKLSLENFVTKSDIIYSWDTTAILWPMLFQKPLFYSTPWWGNGYIPVEKYDAAWVPENAHEFKELLLRLISNPNITKNILKGQKRFLKDSLGIIDGTSSEKLSKLLVKLSDSSFFPSDN